MFDYELEQVKRKLDKLFRRGVLRHRNIYLFGVSDNTRKIAQVLRTYKLEPANILDNDKAKQHSFCSRIKVIPIEEVKEIQNEQNLFISYSLYWREMSKQLREKGVKKENILMLYQGETLRMNLYHAWFGKRVYDNLIGKYGDIPIFLCPYTGTGDIYLIGTFWKQYIKKNSIKDYVFLVISKACEKTAQLFDINHIEVLQNKIEGTYLIKYYMLCPEKVNLKILNDSWAKVHTNPLEWFRGYKGMEFMQLFRKFVFDLPDTARPEHPILEDVGCKWEEIFNEHGLEIGNTIVLSPYSNTLADLPDVFWSGLAEELKKEGYKVCTNSGGDMEPPVSGTDSVFLPLNIAPQWIEKAGYFIGVRSGFCDIISGTKSKKVILYGRQDRFFNGSAFEYFNLKDMGLCDDAVEIQFESSGQDLCMEVIRALR